jgi:DNA-binding XRE family transcriptional regulator
VPPVGPDVVQPKEQLLAQAPRRHEVARHVEDGRLVGQLAAVERTIADEHVAGARLYSDVRRFRVESAIRWALSNRALFPACPLSEEHLAIAEAAKNSEHSATALVTPNLEPVREPRKRLFAKRIDELRKDHGWSVEELAEKVDQDKSTVQAHLGAHSLPHPRNQKKYADAFGVKVSDLLT